MSLDIRCARFCTPFSSTIDFATHNAIWLNRRMMAQRNGLPKQSSIKRRNKELTRAPPHLSSSSIDSGIHKATGIGRGGLICFSVSYRHIDKNGELHNGQLTRQLLRVTLEHAKGSGSIFTICGGQSRDCATHATQRFCQFWGRRWLGLLGDGGGEWNLTVSDARNISANLLEESRVVLTQNILSKKSKRALSRFFERVNFWAVVVTMVPLAPRTPIGIVDVTGERAIGAA